MTPTKRYLATAVTTDGCSLIDSITETPDVRGGTVGVGSAYD